MEQIFTPVVTVFKQLRLKSTNPHGESICIYIFIDYIPHSFTQFPDGGVCENSTENYQPVKITVQPFQCFTDRIFHIAGIVFRAVRRYIRIISGKLFHTAGNISGKRFCLSGKLLCIIRECFRISGQGFCIIRGIFHVHQWRTAPSSALDTIRA